MQRKKININIIIIILILVVTLIYFNQEKPFISVNYYDKDGNPIKTGFSLATIPSGYSADITINVKNDGDIFLTCFPSEVSPKEFSDALTKTNRGIYPSYSTEWTSNKIKLSSFSGKPQPTRFSVIMTCSYPDVSGMHYMNQSGFVELNIGDICGDGACGTTETESSCAVDCFLGDKVIFRTSNNVYTGTHTAIGYTPICGTDLTAYGELSQTCWSVTDATCPTISRQTLIFSQSRKLPGRPSWAGTNIGCLYNGTGGTLSLAWKTASSGGPCTITGRWGVKTYDLNDPDKSYLTDLSSISSDATKEVTC